MHVQSNNLRSQVVGFFIFKSCIFFFARTMKLVSFASLTVVSAEMMLWDDFKSTHTKLYSGIGEEAVRQQIYEANVQKILDHNAQNATWTMAMNEFGDLSHDEFLAMVSSNVVKREEWEGLEHVNVADEFVASSKDWASEGKCNPIRQQGSSNSCWAHAAVASLESAYAIATGDLVKLSEQQLCDCSGCGSCRSGGDEQDALPWYKTHDACALNTYTLTGRDGSCQRCDTVLPAGTVTGTVLVNKDANSWKSALNVSPFTTGVLSANINQFYSSGVLSDTVGSSGVIRTACSSKGDHAVVAVGYGTDNGQAYFKIRNSWGANWGEHGYFRVAQQSSSSKGTACIFEWKGMYPTVRGGGHHPSPPSPTPHQSCTDVANWASSEGDSCATYESLNYCTSSGGQGSGWRSRWGQLSNFADSHGRSALDACCACGGGSSSIVV